MNTPAYKDSKTGTWFVKFYCKDWTGENKRIKKRGFGTKREALDYERNYKIRQENNLDMTFGEFWKLYTEDVKIYDETVSRNEMNEMEQEKQWNRGRGR